MPIKIPDDLPANKILTSENIFVMTEDRAAHQDIRPLEIGILNLMPKKIETETQILRLIGNSPLQVNITLVKTKSYISKNVSSDHLLNFYKEFEEIKDKKFDGFIITGAPVEKMEFEEVAYWNELCEIMQWTTENVFSTFHICWGAQAGLYYHYGIKKYFLSEKLSGIYRHKKNVENSGLLRGFDNTFYVPHSRYTENKIEDIEKCSDLTILSYSQKAGLYICSDKNHRRIFVTGHSEYDDATLKNEYLRDLNAGLEPKVPENYFMDDDPEKEVNVCWRAHANLLYVNWLNYAVYQETPFDLSKLNN